MKVIPYPGNTYWMISLYSNRYEASTSADEKNGFRVGTGLSDYFRFMLSGKTQFSSPVTKQCTNASYSLL